jgi:hypothetical protein
LWYHYYSCNIRTSVTAAAAVVAVDTATDLTTTTDLAFIDNTGTTEEGAAAAAGTTTSAQDTQEASLSYLASTVNRGGSGALLQPTATVWSSEYSVGTIVTADSSSRYAYINYCNLLHSLILYHWLTI